MSSTTTFPPQCAVCSPLMRSTLRVASTRSASVCEAPLCRVSSHAEAANVLGAVDSSLSEFSLSRRAPRRARLSPPRNVGAAQVAPRSMRAPHIRLARPTRTNLTPNTGAVRFVSVSRQPSIASSSRSCSTRPARRSAAGCTAPLPLALDFVARRRRARDASRCARCA
jgi:hypothetical protein